MTQRRMGFLAMVATLVMGWSGLAAAASTPAQKCEAAKNKAAGKKAACLTNERVKQIKGRAPDFAKCSSKFSDAFSKAETKAGPGICPTEGDAARMEARVDTVFNPVTGLPKALAGVRFVDNGDGTVSDTHTALMWEKKTGTSGMPNPSDVHDVNNTYTWSSGTAPDGTAYTTFLATLNNCASPDGTTFTGGFAGHCDWRLPSSVELQTILLAPYPCATDPCINQTTFGPTQSSFYWSASSVAGPPGSAWDVSFLNGRVDNDDDNDTVYVRAVRGGL